MIRRQPRNAGFSLLEVMIALIVIAFALFGIMSMVLSMLST